MQFAGVQRALQLPAFLRQVAAAVGGDLVRQFGRDLGQPALRGQCGLLGAVPGPDEGQGAGTVGHQVGHHPGRLAGGGSAHRRTVLALVAGDHRGFPEHEVGAGTGCAVLGDGPHRSADQPARRALRVGGGGRREDEHRVRPVHPGQPDQPAQHQRDMRAENSAVGVALVDDHVLQPAQHPGPPVVGRQHARGAACPGSSAPSWRGRAPSPGRPSGCRRRRRRAGDPAARGIPGTAVGRRPAPWSGPGRARTTAGRRQIAVSAGSW